MPTDPLSTATSGVKLAEALLNFARRFRFKRKPKYPATEPTEQEQSSPPREFELVPQWFEFSLGQSLPQVNVAILVINYLPAPVLLESIRVSQFQLSECPVFENISTEYDLEISGRNHRFLICRRSLTDREVALVAAITPRESYNAQMTLNARYDVKGQRCQYGPKHSLSANGWLLGRPVQHGVSYPNSDLRSQNPRTTT